LDDIEKAIKELGEIRIEHMTGIDIALNMIGLCPEDYEPETSPFLCPDETTNKIIKTAGGM
jgi:hypothetical protein